MYEPVPREHFFKMISLVKRKSLRIRYSHEHKAQQLPILLYVDSDLNSLIFN